MICYKKTSTESACYKKTSTKSACYKNKNGLSVIVEIVLNDTSYPVQERDHHSLDVLSAGGEDAMLSEQTNPLVNQHETLDAEFNSIEDMVSIILCLKPNLYVLDLTSTTDCHSIHFQYSKLETA